MRNIKCTLCTNDKLQEVTVENNPKIYFLCNKCKLLFMHPDQRLSREEEKKRYQHHINGPDQPGYVKFLNQIIHPALEYINTEMTGLDYGCGPSPTISVLLKERDITCYNYDPVFDFQHPYKQYDFIFATECFEHFFHPKDEIEKIIKLLKPGGFLFVMTERWKSLEQFKTWYYTKDDTHVSFYHLETFTYIRQKYKFSKEYVDEKRVFIMKSLS